MQLFVKTGNTGTARRQEAASHRAVTDWGPFWLAAGHCEPALQRHKPRAIMTVESFLPGADRVLNFGMLVARVKSQKMAPSA